MAPRRSARDHASSSTTAAQDKGNKRKASESSATETKRAKTESKNNSVKQEEIEIESIETADNRSLDESSDNIHEAEPEDDDNEEPLDDVDDDDDDAPMSPVEGLPLSGLQFSFFGPHDEKRDAQLQKLILSNGGKVRNSLLKTVTHCVTTQDALEGANPTQVKRMQRKNLVIVTPEWIDITCRTGQPSRDTHEILKHRGETEFVTPTESQLNAKSKSKSKSKTTTKASTSTAKSSAATSSSNKGKSAKSKAMLDNPLHKDDDVVALDEYDDESQSAGAFAAASSNSAAQQGTAPVDSECHLSNSAHVFEQGQDVYDVMLNQTNLAQNNNKYYIIQLLCSDSQPHQYSVWTRWGRVGKIAGTALADFESLELAQKAFNKKYQDKTKQKWADRAHFVPQSGKYTLIERDYAPPAKSSTAAKSSSAKSSSSAAAKPEPKCTLDKSVQELLAMISSKSMMESQMSEAGFSVDRMPLGKLHANMIEKAYESLSELADEIDTDKPNHKHLVDLSSEFYTLIPHDFGMKKLPVINSKKQIREKLDLLESLSDIQVAHQLLDAQEAECQKSAVHHLDACYHQLDCSIKPVSHDSATFKLLKQYMAQHGSTHTQWELELEDLFEVERKYEAQRFAKKHAEIAKVKDNLQLLWHGSRLTNMMSILKQGLQIAPPQAERCGAMMGRGIYYAPTCSKSAAYCYATRSNPTGLLILSEVTLGDQLECMQAEYEAAQKCKKEGKHWTKGCGQMQPDPKKSVKLDSGCVVPCGPLIDNQEVIEAKGALLYDEHIVYSPDQVKIKYICKTAFKY